jgi:hypothetical protein
MDNLEHERSKTMKSKALFVFFFGIVLSMLVANTGFAGWPVAVAPAIRGTILDATTGKPIENVVLEVNWSTSDMGFADRATGSAGHKLIVTDKNGSYRIPSRVMPQPLGGFFSMFDGMYIYVRHPLYEFKYFRLNKEDLSKMKQSGESGKHEIKVLSLEEKYKNINRTNMYDDKIPMQIYDLNTKMMGNDAAIYFEQATRMGIKKEYFKFIFESWENIINKYNNKEKIYLEDELHKFISYYGMEY